MNELQLKQLIQDGCSVRMISEKIGKSYTAVRYQLAKFGLKTKFGKFCRTKDECRDCGDKLTAKNKYRSQNRKICKVCVNKLRVIQLKENKQKLVDYKGGKCESCGYDRCVAALDFHHLDPKEKEFTIGSNKGKSWEALKVEVDKCAMVCSNCHREIHEGLIVI